MSINSDRLREFFNSDITDAAADELDELEEKLAASEARVGELEKALNEIAEWTERYTTPGHPISTVARAALSASGREVNDAPAE